MIKYKTSSLTIAEKTYQISPNNQDFKKLLICDTNATVKTNVVEI